MSVRSPTLLLFDIDGTLLETGGSGGEALLDAAEEVLKVERSALPYLELAGATDKGIIRELFEHTGQTHHPDAEAAFVNCYLDHLRRRLHGQDFVGRLLPGIGDLIRTLAPINHADIGLLTGNVRGGADLKLRRFELDSYFVDGAFGDDEEDRNLLGPVALRRMQTATGRRYDPDAVIVIGDTPKDIACARALGARCLAVATGTFSREQLQAHQPWRCLDDLADTAEVCELLFA